MSSQYPPKISQFIWSLILPSSIRDSLLGDLDEEFTRIARSQSVARARYWYSMELLRSSGSLLAWRLLNSLAVRALVAAAIGFAAVHLFEAIAFDWVFGDGQRGSPSVYSDVAKVVAFGSAELFVSGMVAGVTAGGLSLRIGSQLWLGSALTLAGFMMGYSIFYAFATPDLMSIQLRVSLMMLMVPFVLFGAWVGARVVARCLWLVR